MSDVSVRFFAKYPTVGTQETLELAPDRVDALLLAKSQMDSMGAMEEIFDILLENYTDYERAAINIALEESIFTLTNMESMFSIQRQINRRLANLLSSVRMYLDQVAGILSEKFATTNVLYNKLRNDCYDSSLSFRIMESLRNTTQHRALPFGLTVNTKKETVREDFRLVFTFSIDLLVTQLESDRQFKRSVLAEVKNLYSKKLSLNSHIRKYVSDIAAIHMGIREALHVEYELAAQALDCLFTEYSKVNSKYQGDFQNYLEIYKKIDDEVTSLGHINDISYRNTRAIRGRLFSLANLEKRVVTSSFD